ncbi:biotin/lipoate A/B protein ligase family protein (plasmid) [Pseudosulfitobacter pseudonitzschiae]|uniref:Biotin/lipoate A/B protein ligase family protein n=1 Tax=Pseudosulfitobacter pseudonitzschiae TaxID=1402135 RepID=A0A221K6A9_9RHOB|nr:biotin/lipoate--protein ligase family protein [Pseudosulfitobacter pseudonitzschiae]ASM74544.1 biotin/lipoate A/B protein ligase family protein [Pseudosulfitobacter pseudonitzschiae]
MTEALAFPPLLWGEAVASDAFEHAAMRAATGCDPGLVVYALGGHTVETSLVFAPEVPLKDAMAMLPLCGIGFQNALGALAPPEVAVHLDWNGGLRLNNAACGRFRCMASDTNPEAVPDWLVVGFTLPLYPVDDPDLAQTGLHPDQTALYAEGCADVAPPELVEAWARHSLHWINRWEDEGAAPLHGEWRGLAYGIGEDITVDGRTGTFLGVDERFGMLLRDGDATHLIPLTSILEPSP